MSVIDDLVEANRRFADSTGALSEPPPMPPSRAVAIVTCMDARIVPAQIFGLREGGAHVIRNAGGRARGGHRYVTVWVRLAATSAVAAGKPAGGGMPTVEQVILEAAV